MDPGEKCDPELGYHVVLFDDVRCQCGERQRLIQEVPEEVGTTSNILGCARCGGEHTVRFKELKNPITLGGSTLTHWGTCPRTKEPILMRFVESE